MGPKNTQGRALYAEFVGSLPEHEVLSLQEVQLRATAFIEARTDDPLVRDAFFDADDDALVDAHERCMQEQQPLVDRFTVNRQIVYERILGAS